MKQEFKTVTPEARLLFPHLFEPVAFEGASEAKYSAVLVFPKGTDISAIRELVRSCGNAAGLKSGARNPICDGNEKVDEWGEVFRDADYIRVSSKFKPLLVDRNRNDILDKDEVYSGCYARAVVRCFAYNKMANSGVSFGVDAIQITRQGEALGGGRAAVGLFGDLPSDKAEDPFA